MFVTVQGDGNKRLFLKGTLSRINILYICNVKLLLLWYLFGSFIVRVEMLDVHPL